MSRIITSVCLAVSIACIAGGIVWHTFGMLRDALRMLPH